MKRCTQRETIERAIERVSREIRGNTGHGRYASALAGEGYAGGYRDALYDVLAVLSGLTPSRRGYWRTTEEAPHE